MSVKESPDKEDISHTGRGFLERTAYSRMPLPTPTYSVCSSIIIPWISVYDFCVLCMGLIIQIEHDLLVLFKDEVTG